MEARSLSSMVAKKTPSSLRWAMGRTCALKIATEKAGEVFQVQQSLPSVSPLFFVQRCERQGKHLRHQFAALAQEVRPFRCQSMVGYAPGGLGTFRSIQLVGRRVASVPNA